MTKEEKDLIMYQANVRMTILYMLPDICEALMVEIEDYRKKAGLHPLRFKDKLAWKGFFKYSRELREVIQGMNLDVQSSFADSCDSLQRLMLYAIDRVGEDNPEAMTEIIDIIKEYPSKRNIEIN